MAVMSDRVRGTCFSSSFCFEMKEDEELSLADDTGADTEFSGLVKSTTCPLCGDWDYQIDELGNCTTCGNTVDNT